MEATVADVPKGKTWSGGGAEPFGASYGKMMMWFFIMSDALTFSGFIGAYGLMRFKFLETWPIADEVFTHVPFIHGHYPMYYVAFMTFVLIFSSVTMVLAVDAGKHMNQAKVGLYMFLTIIGGLIFLGSQAWEWKNFIAGTYGAVILNDGKVVQFVDETGHQVTLESFAANVPTERVQHTRSNGLWFVSEPALAPVSMDQVKKGFAANPNINLRIEKIDPATKKKIIVSKEQANAYLANAKEVVKGANLRVNEYGKTASRCLMRFFNTFAMVISSPAATDSDVICTPVRPHGFIQPNGSSERLTFNARP